MRTKSYQVLIQKKKAPTTEAAQVYLWLETQMLNIAYRVESSGILSTSPPETSIKYRILEG